MINGQWNEWSAWSDCSDKNCGTGIKIRTRHCSNPSPSNGGQPCQGRSVDFSFCVAPNCFKAANLKSGT